MTKELESLNKLKRDLNEHYLSDTAKDVLYQIIETSLTRLEKLEKESFKLSIESLKLLREYRKQNEIFQIIKDHKLLNYV